MALLQRLLRAILSQMEEERKSIVVNMPLPARVGEAVPSLAGNRGGNVCSPPEEFEQTAFGRAEPVAAGRMLTRPHYYFCPAGRW